MSLKKLLSQHLSKDGWYSFPIYPVDLIDTLEDRDCGDTQRPFKDYFVEYIVMNMGGRFNNKKCTTDAIVKRIQHKGEEPIYHFYIEFKFLSKVKAQFKSIKFGLSVDEFEELFNLYQPEKEQVGFAL